MWISNIKLASKNPTSNDIGKDNQDICKCATHISCPKKLFGFNLEICKFVLWDVVGCRHLISGQTNKGWSHIAKFFWRLWRKFSVCVRDKSLSIKRSQVWKLEIKKLLRNKKGRLVRFTFRQQFYCGWKATTPSLSFWKSIRFHWLIDWLIDWLISLIGCRGWRIFQNSNVCILFNTNIHSFCIYFFF